ncbi:MAG: GNAT family N-acetyltransferase, partial [Chitinivibrionales bacterium]|nr:GNAT family N-acetyltransferase [Chitinivibrionales bacterium]
PLYFWNDPDDGRRNNARRVAATRRQIARMIARDRNHPSIVFWSVSNETSDNEPEVAKSNRDLLRHARALDPSRLCVHVSDKWELHPNFAEDHVVCVNGYPSITRRAEQRNPFYDPAESTRHWRTSLEKLRSQYPGKPILVTEFGFSSLQGTNGHGFGEDRHAAVIEAEFAGMDAPYVCGRLIWCWADHAWPASRFSERYATSPFGVLSRDRQRLAPYSAARKLFRAAQGIADPAPSTASGNETGITMIRTHLRGIPREPFPQGYGARPMRREDIALWTDIQRDAEQYLTIGDSLFLDQFGEDLHAIGHRCFIITDERQRGVGTISAWRDRNWRGGDWGRIHWVAVRPSCQGKGVGKAALSFAMRELAKYHARAFLDTDIRRVAAVKLYLDFGFEPDLSVPHAHTVWSALAQTLKHPALRIVGGDANS